MVDVLVLGGGNAALCAALTAREAGASVLLLEARAARTSRRQQPHTRNLRCMHDAPHDVLTDAYPEDEYWQDLLKVTGGLTDERLARMTIRAPPSAVPWMEQHGVRFQPSLGGTLHLSRTNAFFLGGGKALVNAYYAAPQALGVEVALRRARSIDLEHRRRALRRGDRHARRRSAIDARARCVAAAGGFESNLEWLREAWGDRARRQLHRSAARRTTRARVLKLLLDAGARAGRRSDAGPLRRDRRARAEVRRRHRARASTASRSASSSTATAQRFYDEGEDFWPKRYAIWGRLVAAAARPDRATRSSTPSRWAASCRRCSRRSRRDIDRRSSRGRSGSTRRRSRRRSRAFNARVPPGTFDHTVLDDCRPRASRRRRRTGRGRSTRRPSSRYPLRPGITFTYLGVRRRRAARMLHGRRHAGDEHLRRRRDHGRQRPRQGLSRRASA